MADEQELRAMFWAGFWSGFNSDRPEDCPVPRENGVAPPLRLAFFSGRREGKRAVSDVRDYCRALRNRYIEKVEGGGMHYLLNEDRELARAEMKKQ